MTINPQNMQSESTPAPQGWTPDKRFIDYRYTETATTSRLADQQRQQGQQNLPPPNAKSA
jgi:hypothetical protein